MRLLFGIILGIALTIGAAYFHDSNYALRADAGPPRTIVNWDVASEAVERTMQRMRREIGRLTGG